MKKKKNKKKKENIIARIRKDDVAVSPVIAVILMVAITVVLAGVLYAWVSSINPGDDSSVTISKTLDDKGTYWKINIIKVTIGILDFFFLILSFNILEKERIKDYFFFLTMGKPVLEFSKTSRLSGKSIASSGFLEKKNKLPLLCNQNV